MGLPLLIAGLGGKPPGAAAYSISKSLRFNSADSANLTRTFGSPTSQNIFTFSCWHKRTVLGATKNLFGVSTNYSLAFNSSDQLVVTIAGVAQATSTAVFRDPHAWYHIMYVQNGTGITVYVNGTSVATGTGTNAAFNTNVAHQIGSANSAGYLDGYLADIYFIDGTALTPGDFAQTSSLSGAWVPKTPLGLTFGSNGFWLTFATTTNTTTLSQDDAGGSAGSGAGSNDWTANNLSVTAGANNDAVSDTPLNNFPTMAAVLTTQATTISDGGLKIVGGVDGYATVPWGMLSGKWYWEVTITAIGATSTCGISSLALGASGGGNYVGGNATTWGYAQSGNKVNNASPVAYGNTFTTGDVIGVAFDADNGKLFFSKNGTWQNSGDPAAGTNAAFTSLTSTPYYPAIGARVSTSANTNTVNFGQQAFSYTPPTGFSALCTSNMAVPTIAKGNTYFDVDLYTGTGAARSTTGKNFQPDLTWIKGRSGATSHGIYDSSRGVQKDIGTDLTTDETTEAQGVTAFNSDGFSVGTLAKLNTNTATYAAWLMKKGVTPGFDIVTWTGNGSNRTIAHALGVAPKFMIVKARTTAGADQAAVALHIVGMANTEYAVLNSTAAKASGATMWNSTYPTSSVFSLGTNAAVNTNSDTYVGYLWAEVAGFSRFGTYTGNANAAGPFVWCGFRPRFILIKCMSTTGSWWLFDTARDTINPVAARLVGEATTAEASSASLDILSNGFKLRTVTADPNAAQTYAFAAFAETPVKYATAR